MPGRPDIPPPRERLPRGIRTQVFERQNGRCASCGATLILGFFEFCQLERSSQPLDRQLAAEPGCIALCWSCRLRPEDH